MGFFKRIFGSTSSSKVIPRKPYSEIIPTLKIDSNKVLDVQDLVEQFKKTRERYEVVSKQSGVPSDVLFAIHYREASLNFKCVLHNGERIIGTGLLTRLVPKGRGPFRSWEEAAIDALEIEKHKFPTTWDLEGKLTFCEKYNGLGYSKRNVPSPYVLAWTNGYSMGKYVADGKYDPSFIDKQCGVAAILLGIGNA
jgi:lysozyme family protein